MSYLLSISIGPVQGFIAASRRTADLDAGSYLLSRAAQLAARTLQVEGASLIFPPDPDYSSSNKILAEIDRDPMPVSRRVGEVLHEWLLGEWKRLEDSLAAEALSHIDTELARDQIAHFLEYYTAWVPLRDYQESRRRVEMLLASRKALRDFEQPRSVPGRIKSTLDPSRDCIIKTGPGFRVPAPFQAAPFWLKPRETLDAVSLLKRWLNRPGVPSTLEMAVRSILSVLEKTDPGVVGELKAMADDLGRGLDLGDLFFPDRLEAEYGGLPRIKEIRSLVKRALKAAGHESLSPYYAILVGDGDHIGRLISAQRTSRDHRALSTSLARFAEAAAKVVSEWNGYAVYSRGDDVFALLPANTAVECSECLRRLFAESLRDFTGDTGIGEASISIGVALCHCLDPLQVSIDRARECLAAAKKARDSLCIGYFPRGGDPVRVSLRWDEVKDLQDWTAAFRRGLSKGLPYEIANLAREWRGVPLAATATEFGILLRSEAERIVQRKESPVRPDIPAWVTDSLGLTRLGELAIVGRVLSQFPPMSVVKT